MSKQTTTRRGVLTLTGGALVALAGCSDGGEGTPTETDVDGDPEPTETEPAMDTETETETDTGGDAMLRVAHLSPDAPNVDVAVDGSTVLEAVAFGTVSDYLPLAAGDHDVAVTPTGGTDPVFDETVTLETGLQTAAAIGEVSGESQEFTVSLLTEQDTLPESGDTTLRAVHVIPDAPAVDVTAGETVIADNLAFGEAGEYLTAPSDTGTVELRPESDGDDADPVGTFDVDLTDGAVQTVFAAGYLDPSDDQPAATLVVATDAAPDGMGTDDTTATATDESTETGTDDTTATATDGM